MGWWPGVSSLTGSPATRAGASSSGEQLQDRFDNVSLKYINNRLDSQFSKTRTKLMVLGMAMVRIVFSFNDLPKFLQILSSPFAFGVLALDPPWAFASLFVYYLLGGFCHQLIKFSMSCNSGDLVRNSVHHNS